MGLSYFNRNLLITAVLSLSWSTPVFSYYADVIDLGALYEVLLEQINSFPMSQFESDPELVQTVNRANSTTTYKFLDEDFILFARPVDDNKKKVVVLTRKDDQIVFRKAKRGYVVLVKNPLDSTYYGEFAFIRPTTSPYDKNTVIINGGVRSFIEWIPFDGHWVKGRLPKKAIAMSCVSSVLVSCLFDQSFLVGKNVTPAAAPYIPKTPTSGEIAEAEIIRWTTYEESDPDENYDFYADLNLGPITGFASVDEMTEAIQRRARSILCLSAPEVCTFNKTDLPIIGLLPLTVSPDLKNGSVVGRRKRDAENLEVKPPTYFPGWKTQYVTVGPGSYLITPKPAEYYGFGNCPFNNSLGPDYLFNNATSVDDFLTFYLTILRVGCISTMKPLMEKILKSGVLVVDNVRKIFDIMLNHKYLTQAKLTTDEYVHLGVAFEFAIFTQNYASNFTPKNSSNIDLNPPTTSYPVVNSTSGHIYMTPTGKPGSQSIGFFTTLVLDYLKTIRIKARPHLIHLTRSMAQNTRFILFKLAQDGHNLAKSCQGAACAQDKTINFNDRTQVMALHQFIKQGLGPVEKELVDLEDAFIQFYKDNESNIEKFVLVYAS